jgi:hypothetical protein
MQACSLRLTVKPTRNMPCYTNYDPFFSITHIVNIKPGLAWTSYAHRGTRSVFAMESVMSRLTDTMTILTFSIICAICNID